MIRTEQPASITVTCPAWCRLREPGVVGHEAHMAQTDIRVQDGKYGDGLRHWGHEAPRIHESLFLELDQCVDGEKPPVYAVEFGFELGEVHTSNPAELRILADALVKAAEWLEAHQ